MAALIVALLLPSLSARGDDWPMFGRDASRNAVSPEKGAPISWQIEKKRTGQLLQPPWNIKWEAQLGGGQHLAAPVVAGGLVWIGTTNPPAGQRWAANAAALLCLGQRDGKLLWRYVCPWEGTRFEDPTATGIRCSPLVQGDRLWLLTNRAEVVCLDISPLLRGKGEPRQLWKRDLRKDLGVRLDAVPKMLVDNLACSIGASWQGRIYLATGNGLAQDGKTVAAPDAPSLVCLDKNSGKVL
jgi:outer membrane protein assembly factor BamB